MFLAGFHGICRELMHTYFKLIHKTKREEVLPESFLKPVFAFRPKPGEDEMKTQNYRPTSLINIDAKVLGKIPTNRNQ